MSQNPPDYTNLYSMLVAVAALGFTVYQFWSTTKLQEKIATVNVQPLLDVIGDANDEYKKIILQNNGSGTAVITQLSYQRGNRTALSIPQLLDESVRARCGNACRAFRTDRVNLRAGAKIELFVVEKSWLPELERDALFSELQTEVQEITLNMAYKDAFGKEQPSGPQELHDALEPD